MAVAHEHLARLKGLLENIKMQISPISLATPSKMSKRFATMIIFRATANGYWRATADGKIQNATPEQKTASNPAASAWVGANAGSGKTHVLVDRVTRLMLAGVDPMSILCLTYTKAAAKEMANRLHERLGAWVGLSNAALTEQLVQMGHDEVDHKTLSRARRLFTAALETPGGSRFKRSMPSAKESCSFSRSRPGLLRALRFWNPANPSSCFGRRATRCCARRRAMRASPFARALEIITRHTHSDSFDALLERLLSKRQILKDAIAAARFH